MNVRKVWFCLESICSFETTFIITSQTFRAPLASFDFLIMLSPSMAAYPQTKSLPLPPDTVTHALLLPVLPAESPCPPRR